MLISLRIAVFILAASQLSQALKVTILADTNRDGIVNDKDHEGRDKWTQDRGALFLANIADTDQRCSSQLKYPNWNLENTLDEITAKEKELDLCNDASDDIQRNPKYLAPLRTLPIKSRDLPEDATGTIQVVGNQAASLTRIFVKVPGEEEWSYVNATHKFNAEGLKKGLELGVDARDVRRQGPDGWDGHATIQFTIFCHGRKKASDSVALRVAPVLTHHPAQKAQRTFVSNGPRDDSEELDSFWSQRGRAQNQFADEFAQNSASAGIKASTFRFYEGGDPWNMLGDPWTQDFFEPGFTSIPGPDGPVVLRIMIRSAQSYRKTGREVFHRLRSESVGAVQTLGKGSTYDSMGNLETIPPHEFKGKSYPAGRIMMGRTESKEPIILDFLRAQEVQAPITLDVSWLVVGHVDEFLQFLPAHNKRGWVLMVDDPIAGLEIIKAAAAKNGSAPALSRPSHPYDRRDCRYNETLDGLLAFTKLTEVQEFAAAKIQLNLDILKREIGLRDEDIYRVPGLSTNNVTGVWKCRRDESQSLDNETEFPDDEDDVEAVCPSGSRRNIHHGFPADRIRSILGASTPAVNRCARIPTDSLRSAEDDDTPASEPFSDNDRGESNPPSFALYPSAINSLVLNNSLVLAAKQWGPIINGVDVLEEAVREAYAKVGFDVKFQDDWFSHHGAMGEIRCGSNVWREADVEWWKK